MISEQAIQVTGLTTPHKVVNTINLFNNLNQDFHSIDSNISSEIDQLSN